jgi:hypothetical protein
LNKQRLVQRFNLIERDFALQDFWYCLGTVDGRSETSPGYGRR